MTRLSHITVCPLPHHMQPIEIVERKGIGHPDTLCDALAEQLSRNLCRFYLDNFGFVLHHNVDKVLLSGGVSASRFGGGKIIAPIEIYIAGRATSEYNGVSLELDELVTESCQTWLKANFHALDVESHVKLHNLVKPGSSDLVELYLRQQQTGIALANDTSCGVGYAPLSELELITLRLEQTLNSAVVKTAHPETGEDIKVMAVRDHELIELTVSCAFIDRYIADAEDYVYKKWQLATLVEETARQLTDRELKITINAADDIGKGSLYLTVTGTSAESGDDGEVGRGNRVNGLITPYRPMNMEAAAGKNPVTHVGKLYNIVAQQIAYALVRQLEEVDEAYCYLVSRIGSPVNEPLIVDIRVLLGEGGSITAIQKTVDEIVAARLDDMQQIRLNLINDVLPVY